MALAEEIETAEQEMMEDYLKSRLGFATKHFHAPQKRQAALDYMKEAMWSSKGPLAPGKDSRSATPMRSKTCLNGVHCPLQSNSLHTTKGSGLCWDVGREHRASTVTLLPANICPIHMCAAQQHTHCSWLKPQSHTHAKR